MATGKANIDVIINASDANNTIRSLNAEYFKLKRSIKDAEVGSKEYNETAKRLAELKGILADHNRNINQTAQSWGGLRNAATSALSISAGLFAIDQIAEMGGELLNVTDKVKAYEQALDSLSAITGVTGDDLRDLENRAASLTSITVAGGKEITNTSTDILDAFRLVGSAKPELLKSAEGMQAFTREAIIFAKSGGMQVEEAVDALSTTLSQFEAPATDATRYINAMAAGAKEGSAEISDVAASIREFGAGASSFNVTVEESVALTEVLADKMIKGSEAGTALRNILLIMKAPDALSKEAREELDKHGVSTKKLADTNLSLSERLKELAKIGNDATAMAKVFGKENVTAGEIVLRNTERFDQLTKSVTGTSEAYTQAAIMSDNLGSDIESMKNTMDEAATQAGNALAPSIRAVVQAFTGLVKWVQENINGIRTFIGILASAGLAVGAYYAAVQAVIIAKRVWTAVTAAASVVQLFFTDGLFRSIVAVRALNFVMSANPIGVFIALLTAAAAAIAMFSNNISQAARNQMMLNDVNNEAARATVEQKTKLQQLLEVAKDEKRSKEDRIKAVKALNELSPKFLGNLTLEKIGTQEATDAVNKYVAALDKRAKADAALSKRTELEKKLLELKTTGAGAELSYLQMAGNAIASMGSVQKNAILNMQSGINNAKEVRAGVESEIAALNKYVSENQIDFTTNTVDNTDKGKGKGGNSGGTSNTNAKDKADEALRILERFNEQVDNFENDIAQRTTKGTENEILKIQEKYQKQLDALEDFKKKFPARIEDANKIEKTLSEQQNREIIALNLAHLNEIQDNLDKSLNEQNLAKMSEFEREREQIIEKYAADLKYLRDVEAGKILVTTEAKAQANAQILALETALNNDLEALRLKQKAKDEAGNAAFWTQYYKDKEDAKKAVEDELSKQVKVDDSKLTTPQYLERLKTTQQLEVEAIKAHFAELIKLAEDYGLDVAALKEKEKAEIAAIEAKTAADETTRIEGDNTKKLQLYQSLSTELGNIALSMGEIFAKEGDKNTKFQKAMALAQIAFDTASGISSAIASGMKVGITPIEKAVVIAGGIALVLTNIAKAKKVIEAAPVVQRYEGGYTTVTGAQDGRKYRAQYVTTPDTGMLPNSPILYQSASGYPVLASERGREFLVSNKSLQNPIVMDYVRAIENIERNGGKAPAVMQRYEGGYTAQNTSSTATAPQNDALLMLAIELKRLNNHLDAGIEATIKDDTILSIMKRYKRLDNATGNALDAINQ